MSDGSAEVLNSFYTGCSPYLPPAQSPQTHVQARLAAQGLASSEWHGMSNELYRKTREERKSKEEHWNKLVVGTYEAVQTGNLHEIMTDFTFKCNVICLSLLQCPYYLFGCLDASYIAGLIQQGLGPSEVLKYHRKHGRGLTGLSSIVFRV